MREYRAKNKEYFAAYNKEYRNKNAESLKEYQRVHARKNVVNRRIAKRKYKLANKEKVRASERIRMRRKFHTDPQYKLRVLAGAASQRMVKAGWTKRHRSAALIGCTWEQLKVHMESQFKPGMTWRNHSKFGWHIDHIRPLSSFDLTQPDQMEKAMHYTNLQPLWWRENVSKSAKWEQPCGQMALF